MRTEKSTALAAEFTTSPALRPPVREDFPPILESDTNNLHPLLDTLKAELAKDGKNFETAGPISIVMPQRMADNRGRALEKAKELQAKLEHATGRKWPIADDIFQTDTLHRSYNAAIGSPGHFRQQHFASASAFKKGDTRHYFLAADDAAETGTTLTDLIGYIEHNGGRVLAASAHKGAQPHLPKLSVAASRLEKVFGATAARAATLGFEGGNKGWMNAEEKIWYRLGAALKKMGLDVRTLNDEELPPPAWWQENVILQSGMKLHEAIEATMVKHLEAQVGGPHEAYSAPVLQAQQKEFLRAHTKDFGITVAG